MLFRYYEIMSDEDEKKEENQEPEDDVVEFEFNEDGEEDLNKTLKKLRADLKACRKEKDEYLLGWQKERADFINYKKQEEDRKVNFSESVRERILVRFLSVLDSFNMAMGNKEVWQRVDESWRRGMEHIRSQMSAVFEEYGIKAFGEEGESFDPNIHQSIDMVETTNKELDHKIANVREKGYKLGERVIRPAGVNVYEYKEPSQ